MSDNKFLFLFFGGAFLVVIVLDYPSFVGISVLLAGKEENRIKLGK